uniref:Elongation of very long chain fatty acids protein n=1 Tax=Parascaris univalens TaxID=6257 RepID=A0A914ZNM5_PARUN
MRGVMTVPEQVLAAPKFDLQRLIDIASAPEFPEQASKDWVTDHQAFAIQICVLYLVVIFGTKYFMKSRQSFELFYPLNMWNAFLAAFSIAGTVTLLPEFVTTISNHGFIASYCKRFDFMRGANGFWGWMFILSKMLEMGDTVFLVLRKKPLLFLHWYHHLLTLIYAFYSYPSSPGFNRWGVNLNFFVHAFMYSYYFIRSLRIRLPGAVAKFITTLQILQFAISLTILVHLGMLIFIRKVECDFDLNVFILAIFMESTYLILFINFFLRSYVVGGGKSKYRGERSIQKQH